MCVLLAGFSVASVVVLAGVPDTPALIISGALDKLVRLMRGWMKDALSPPLAYSATRMAVLAMATCTPSK